MPYRVIAGEYHIRYPDLPNNGPEPDGDTLKFRPDNRDLVEGLQGRSPDFNSRGMVNIRFEGVDALETHFGEAHQELVGAEAARDYVLAAAGFNDVVFFDDAPNKVKSVGAPHPTRGHILAKDIDPHGRVIGFVYPGDPPEPDGSQVFLAPPRANASINGRLLVEGHVYPAFYSSLPVDLKDGIHGVPDQPDQDGLRDLAEQARASNRGLWPRATAQEGDPADIPNLAATEDLVIWPKLFRRLVSYFGEGNVGLGGFDAWLRVDNVNRDDFILLPDRELGNMHDLFVINGNQIEMRFDPEDLVIVPDGVLPPPPPRPGPTPVPDPAPTPGDVVGMVRIVAALANVIGPERGNETVTLVNVSPSNLDMAGWEITDASDRARDRLHGILEAGTATQVKLQNVQLSNQGDTIVLLDHAGTQVDQVRYTRAQAQREGWTIVDLGPNE